MEVEFSTPAPVSNQPKALHRKRFRALAGLLVVIGCLATAGWHLIRERARTVRQMAYLHASLGVDRYEAGQTAAAIAEFEEAARLDPENAHAWYLLGETQREQNSRAGLPALYQAATRAPANVQYQRAYGLALVDSGRVDEALPLLTRAVSADPSEPQVHVALARVYLARVNSPDDFQRALGELRTALSLAPGDIQARFRLARALYQGNRLPEARREFEQTLYLLAVGAVRQTRPLDGATDWSATWLSIVKGCHYNLMQIAYRLQNAGEAREHERLYEGLEKYIKETNPLLRATIKDPTDQQSRRQLAAAYERYGLPAKGADPKTSVRHWIGRWAKPPRAGN